jgi:chromosome transmission fidelity protein 4
MKHDTQLHGFLTNTNGVRIRSVTIDPKGKKIAVASESVHRFFYRTPRSLTAGCYSELFIKLIDAEDTTIVQKLQGHTKGVRRVSWDPTSAYLVCHLL